MYQAVDRLSELRGPAHDDEQWPGAPPGKNLVAFADLAQRRAPTLVAAG
jgi:hypothetical protein